MRDSRRAKLERIQSTLENDKLDDAVREAFWAGETLVQHEIDWRLVNHDCRLDLGINTKGLHNARQAWDEYFAPRFNVATIPLTWGVLEPIKNHPQYTFWATTDAPILWHRYLYGLPQELYRLPWAAGQGLLRDDLTPKPALNEIGLRDNG